MDRVTRAVLHGARGNGQHLGEQLATEDPGPEVLDTARFKAIVAEPLGVERVEQHLERAGHVRARLPYPKRRVKARARGNPARALIKGAVCGVRVEDIKEPTMREIRYLDKLIDELAKGRAMDKILRKE